MAKVSAARSRLRAASDKRTSNNMPVGGDDLDRIIDHTDGKATQAIALTASKVKVRVPGKPPWTMSRSSAILRRYQFAGDLCFLSRAPWSKGQGTLWFR
jgi:hypothetical protein